MAINNERREDYYCSRCKDEGKDTLLFYSDPPKKSDSWTKGLKNESDYRCREHVRKDSGTYRKSKKKNLFKDKKEEIEQYHRQKIIEFETIWNDGKVKERPEPERLMEGLRDYNIRGQKEVVNGHTHDGYTAEEMAEIIRAEQINFSASKWVEQWDEDNKNRLTRFTREEIKPEITRVLLEFESDIKTSNRKHVVNSIRNMIEAANRLYEQKTVYEKIVTTPGHRDPAGNTAARFHLLTLEETLNLRRAKKQRQITSINSTIEKEEKIQGKVQEHMKAKEEIKGTENNDNIRSNESS